MKALKHKDLVSIFDLSSVNWDSAGRALLQADASADAVDLNLSRDQLMDRGLEDFLEETGMETIYQLTCRDRNRIALLSELLGAGALSIRNILAWSIGTSSG